MKVTIAIPFYNAEAYILDAIRSVFAQTHQEWELILIDDGSTDNSLKIAKSINDPRVKVLSDGKNKRLATRLNEVTDIAKYDYIARMDADDLMLPNRITRQLDCFKQHPELDLVTTGVYSVLNDLTIKGIRGQDYFLPSFNEIISKQKGVTHAAIVAKKSWYKRNRYDESLSIAQDLDLWIRASHNKDFKIMSIDTPLYIYREEDNVTADKLLRAYKNERKMISKYYPNGYKLILKSYLKSSFVKTLNIINQIDTLQKRRSNRTVSKEDQIILNDAINQINTIELPLFS